MNRYETGLEGFSRRTEDLAKSGSLPPWSPIAGFALLAVIVFSLIVQAGGDETPAASGNSITAVSEMPVERPSAPTATTAEAPAETTTPQSIPTVETILDANGLEVAVPAAAVDALVDLIARDAPGSEVDLDATTVAVSDSGFNFEAGFLTNDGRFFSASVTVEDVDGTWVASVK